MDVEAIGLFWAWLTLIMSVIYFARPQVLADVKQIIVEDTGFRLLYGMASLILGLGSVTAVNVWSLDWRGLVTLFGWLALIKGIITLSWPEVASRTPDSVRMSSTRWSLAAACLLAAALLVAIYLDA